MGNVNVPLAVYQEGSGLTISNLTFYINKTDSHYYLMGIAKSVLPETLHNGIKSIIISFEDKTTTTKSKSATKTFNPVNTFASFENPSMRILRFVEPYLSDNKADPSHSNTTSFKNCMLRIPGSHNSKCVMRNNRTANYSAEIKIIQKWNGYKLAIN